MMSSAERKMFKDETNILVGICLVSLLEKTVRLGIRLNNKNWTWQNLVLHALESRAVPIIWEILQTIDPKVFESVREINARVIWTIYWRLKNNPANKNMSFLDLLIELNKNPPFAMAFG